MGTERHGQSTPGDPGGRRRPGGDAGFGIVELIMAVTVLGFVMLAMGAVMGASLKLVGTNRQRVVAANLASEELETVRSTPYADLAVGAEESTEEVDGSTYEVVREIDWMSQEAGVGACDAPGDDRDLLSVRVSVSWDSMGAIPPVQSETIISATGSTGTATEGNLALALLGGDDQPVPGVTVSLSGGPTGTSPLVTSSTGCAYFTGLEAGTYTASLSRPGYVDGQGNAAVVVPNIGLTGGATTPVQLTYDRAATVALTIAAPAGRQVPTGLPVTVANTNLTPNGTRVLAAGGVTQTHDLFPYASGYSVWAGACADADPMGVVPDSVPAQRYYPSATRPAPVQTLAGGTTSAVVSLQPVDVTVRRSGSALGGAQVRAVHADPEACAGTAPLELALGTTDASGALATALPLGTWRLEVVGAGAPISPTAPTVVAPGAPTLAVGVIVP